MDFGIWTPLPHTIRHEPRMAEAVARLQAQGEGLGEVDPAFAFARDIVTRAEDYGFRVTLIAERLLGPDPEAWVLASALAAVTHRIELMVACHAGGVLTPPMVAKLGASLDRISGGRASLNVINGWWQQEMDAFGSAPWLADPEARAARMGEFVDVVRGLWQSPRFDYEGSYYRCNGLELPIRPVRPEGLALYAAGRSPASRRIVAGKCDTWFAEYSHPHAEYGKNVVQLRDEIARMKDEAAALGRSLTFGISAHAICADTMEEALAQADEMEAYGRRDPIARIAANALGPGLIGTPEAIAERLDLYAAAGIDLVMLKFSPMAEQLDTFATRVMPLVR